jgi:hypothetical protein
MSLSSLRSSTVTHPISDGSSGTKLTTTGPFWPATALWMWNVDLFVTPPGAVL